MIKSMTGFGKGARAFKSGEISAEVKTLNHKFLEISIRMPDGFEIFDAKLRQKMQKYIKRGKVLAAISVERKEEPQKKIKINKKAAARYKKAFTGLAKALGCRPEISLETIISMPDIVKYETVSEDASKLLPSVSGALDAALLKVLRMRKKEGAYLFKDLRNRARLIEHALLRIKKRSPLVVERYRQKLIKSLETGVKLAPEDEQRLEKEVAAFARNCDISEEVTRMYSHVESFMQGLTSKGEAGRMLDFIAQELHREVNTVGSKASDFKIQQDVIRIKGEIDKIREQVQNIE